MNKKICIRTKLLYNGMVFRKIISNGNEENKSCKE